MPSETAIGPAQITAAKEPSGFESLFRVLESLRSEIESRRRRQLAKVANAEAIITKLVSSVDRSMIDVVITVGLKKRRLRKPVSDLEVVECAVATFGEEIFLLDELVARVARVSPGRIIAREAISRRLYDLKRKGLVIAARHDSGLGHPRTQSYFAYRRSVGAKIGGHSQPPVP